MGGTPGDPNPCPTVVHLQVVKGWGAPNPCAFANREGLGGPPTLVQRQVVKGWGGEGGGAEIVPTTTGTPIPQPEARYHNQKLDPTTTEQLFTQNRSLVQLECVLCLV